MGRGPEARPVRATLATASYFTTLGVQPFMGRFFSAEEDVVGGGPAVVVLGHRFWRDRFAANRDVLGQGIHIGSQVFTVIGVAPEGFAGVDLNAAEVFLPIGAGGFEFLGRDTEWATTRNWQWIRVIARPRSRRHPRIGGGPAHRLVSRGGLERHRHHSQDQHLRDPPDRHRPEPGRSGERPGDGVAGPGLDPGAAHRLRQRGQPLARAGCPAPSRDRGAARPRRSPAPAGGPAPAGIGRARAPGRCARPAGGPLGRLRDADLPASRCRLGGRSARPPHRGVRGRRNPPHGAARGSRARAHREPR